MKRDTDQTNNSLQHPLRWKTQSVAGLTKAMNSAAGRMDSNLTIGHNSYPRNRRGWAIVRSSALLLTAQAATSREDASSEQSLALMIDWEFDTTAAAEGLLAKLRADTPEACPSVRCVEAKQITSTRIETVAAV